MLTAFVNIVYIKLETEVSKGHYMKEKTRRSVVKALSWRITGTMDTIVVSYIVTGNPHLAFTIGGVEVVTKFILYFFHERLWNKIGWGREKETEIEYNI
jgi:uncharacterized membrane protein